MNVERIVPGSRETHRQRVLLADDSEMVRKAIAVLLSKDPEIELVGEADTLAETMRLARKLKPDIVILDLHLDEKVSPSEIKARFSGTQLLAIYVWTDAESQTLADEFGASRLLGKSSLAVELIPAIKQQVGIREQRALDSQAKPHSEVG